MIDFNDACRYQNFLQRLFSEAVRYLADDDFVTTTVKTHHKSDANKNASDEVEMSKSPFDGTDITPSKMIQFTLDVLEEREKLAVAIAFAKAQADLQVDAACMINKDKTTLSRYFDNLSGKKARELEGSDTAYMINEVDGKQTPYIYKTTTVKKINFDRNVVKGISTRLKREMKETSKNIERFNLDTQVDFEPRWSEEDTLEDILSA